MRLQININRKISIGGGNALLLLLLSFKYLHLDKNCVVRYIRFLDNAITNKY